MSQITKKLHSLESLCSFSKKKKKKGKYIAFQQIQEIQVYMLNLNLFQRKKYHESIFITILVVSFSFTYASA